MTLLSICGDVCQEVSISPPGTIINNTAPDAQKLLRYAKRVGTRLMKKVPWQVLRKERTFTSISGSEQTGILPDDFDRFVPETFWNRSSTVLLSGPVSSVDWQGMKAGGYSGDPKFTYRGGSVYVLPELSGGESLAFEYISNQWCQSSGDVGQATWAADTDTGVIDEELITLGMIVAHLAGEGLPIGDALDAFTERLDMLSKNERAASGVLSAGDIFNRGGRHFGGAPRSNFGFLLGT